MYNNPPAKRSECVGKERPCPWIRCKHHMIWGFPNINKMSDDEVVNKILELSETCVLDVADKGAATLEEIAEILGVTRERVRQLEETKHGKGAIPKLRKLRRRNELEQFATI